jgi:hypothetical protein
VVAPLDNVRPNSGLPRAGGVSRPGQPAGSFDAELNKALENLAAQAPANPAGALLGDDLAASLQLASQSLQRATAHINAARGYFRGAAPTPPPLDAGAPSVDRGA